MEIIKKNIDVKVGKDYLFNVNFDLKVYGRDLYQDVPNLTEESYWNHAVSFNDVEILFNGVKVNGILNDDISDKVYTKIMDERRKFIKQQLCQKKDTTK